MNQAPDGWTFPPRCQPKHKASTGYRTRATQDKKPPNPRRSTITQSGTRTGGRRIPPGAQWVKTQRTNGQTHSTPDVNTLDESPAQRIQLPATFLPSAPHYCSPDPDHLPAWGSALPILRDPEGNFTGRRDNSDLRGLVDRGRTAVGRRDLGCRG